jgi:type I restriction enzyme, R subunit
LEKHNAATNSRRFNAVLATASINNAIEYYQLFKEIQKKKQAENPDYVLKYCLCVFTSTINCRRDQQSQKNSTIQEDLTQERRQQTKS